MKIRKGDNVIVIAGKDKGKSGVVAHAYPKESMVLIEGINSKKRHQKPRKGGQKGQIVEKSMPIHVSNIMIKDPKGNKGSRISIKRDENKRVRIATKSGSVIEK